MYTISMYGWFNIGFVESPTLTQYKCLVVSAPRHILCPKLNQLHTNCTDVFLKNSINRLVFIYSP